MSNIVITLSTGRQVEAWGGILGINAELEIYEGYDTPFDFCFEKWTPGEKIELADHMITIWKSFREKQAGG